MKDFTGKVAAITGAGSGIGRALALNLAGHGCHLALSDINAATLAETAKQAQGHGSGVRVSQQVLDVADRQAVHSWADAVAAEHGAVHLIFNNAGVALGSTVASTQYSDFEWLMNINFWGVVHGTRAFLPHLKASGEGHIINISSVFGLFGVPGQSVYNAAKFAVRGYTESLRQELDLEGGGVSATSVHPGGIKTNIARAARMTMDAIGPIGIKDPDRARADFEKQFRTTPERAATVILNAVRHNQRRVLVGPDAHVLDLMVRLMPSSYQRVVEWAVKRSYPLSKTA